MYLEWAPENTLTEGIPNQRIQETKDTKSEEHKPEQTNAHKQEVSDDEEPEENTTLFVKNLNFETTDENLRKVNKLFSLIYKTQQNILFFTQTK